MRAVDRDAALGALATRYLQSHGPAAARDLAWWSGLTLRDAQRAVAIARARAHTIDGVTYWSIAPFRVVPRETAAVRLLPVFDEYLVAYRDLTAVPRLPSRLAGLDPAVVSGGEIIGTWRLTRAKDRCTIDVATNRALTRQERSALADESRRLGEFLDRPVVCRLASRVSAARETS